MTDQKKFLEPPSTFKNLEVDLVDSSGKLATLKDRNEHTDIEVSYLSQIGWMVEVRYDRTIEGFVRQCLTGEQERCASLALTIEKSENGDKISADSSSLIFKGNGSISLSSHGHNLLHSTGPTFSVHRKEQEIYENLMSLKVTDFSKRSPSGPHGGSTYKTHMVRFQYELPSGVILGLPGQTGELNRRGYRFELYNTDTFCHTPSRTPLYQSWPILMHRSLEGDFWIGIFHDNPTRTFVDLGDFYPDKVTFESCYNNSRIYLLIGNSIGEVSSKFSKLLGVNSLPPAWAFGYQQCRWSYMSTNEIRSISRSFRSNKIPCDAIYFDIDYMEGFKVFTHDQKHFEDLVDCVKEIKDEGFSAIPIIDPGVKIEDGYGVYEDLIKNEHVLKDSAGGTFEIVCWPGKAVLPDFGDPDASNYWAQKLSKWFEEYKWDGLWNDMNEPANFDGGNQKTSTSFTARGAITKEYNLYGYNMAKAAKDGWHRAAPNKRPLVITRSGYPGVQNHAVTWHGDNHAWWEHLSLAMHTAVSYSMFGSYYTGADVPGFTGNPSDDLAIRFFQLGAWLPFYRGHSIYFAKDKEPFAFTETTCAKHIRAAIEQRYSLAREWYSGFWYCLSHKTSPLLPVLDKKNSLVSDQFTLFNKYLVAPIIVRDQQYRLIYLPEGDWYALGNRSEKLSGDRWLTYPVDLSKIPIFVRAGSVVVRNTVGKNIAETLSLPESYEIYPDISGAALGIWYGDDGISLTPNGVEAYRLRAQSTSSKVLKDPLLNL